ncbi:MAG: phenylalanine--tRNA ligase subunit beta [Candidatus Anoxymicrobium japonicum]|uniref:Phenylalanine--tRNA ligase beta subunit n=1 Tax=Candidatus Anoxymicrobium japonicum TaxID=2013648 RepID=A0A2N3G6R9_9ACTN|nr:MAG: phenylalanine--tRNA ligase subunit beta [Candidatus Anoxymicrobium japonicum]
MRVSLEWLKEYVDISMTAQELADALSMSGTAVDRVLTLDGGVTGVVVARVVEVKPHQNADNLRIAVVDDGTSVREIVCGAPNLEAGMMSPFAREGAMLPAVSTKPLRKARIRGVESDGMLLSAVELGISDERAGILELPPDTPLGVDLSDILPLEDVVLDLEITPNRPDCMSMTGVAREVSALTGAPIHMPVAGPREKVSKAGEFATIIVEDTEGCPRYTAMAVTGVTIGPSPAWMQRRLMAAGVRPISNVVDVTNYVLLETGQPLHVFDLDLLSGKSIVVRRARPSEIMRTLDGVDRSLDDRSLVIADADKPVALAGIMGGEGSHVTDHSTNLLIESAHFDSTSILLTSRRLGIRTEASARFERGVDPSGTSFAAMRASRLIVELSGGRLAEGEIDVYPAPVPPRKIFLRPGRVNSVLGTDIAASEMTKILKSLGAGVEKGEALSVTVPTYRRDLEREIDLIEEIARVCGYDRIRESLPVGGGVKAGPTREQSLFSTLVDTLVAQGLSQVVTYSFMNPGDLDSLEIPKSDERRRVVALLNPLAETGEVMRTTLVPGLLRVAAGNINRGKRDLSLFETGRAFIARGKDELPREIESIALLLCGSADEAGWSRENRAFDFFDLKGVIENLGLSLAVEKLEFDTGREPFLAAGRAASVMIDGNVAGYIGQLHPRVAAAYDIDGEFYIGEILTEIFVESGMSRVYNPVGRYPGVKVDIAVVVEENLGARVVEESIRESGGTLLESVRLFDVYRGPQVAGGKKSLAYALEFGSSSGTLTDEQAHAELKEIIAGLEKNLGASIRGREREGEDS